MSTLELHDLTAVIGAEVVGIALTDVVDDASLATAVRAALSDKLVLTFRDQHLDDETHKAVASIFGTPLVHPIMQALGGTEPMEEISDSPEKLPDRDGWHTDAPFLVQPPAVAVLRALKVPATGGDTLWANMEDAFDALSPAMQSILAELRVCYPPQEGLFSYVEEHLGADVAERTREITGAGGEHPIVRTHPDTGRRAVYYAEGFAGPIVGLHPDENAALRAFLTALPKNPNRQCRWRWHEGDVVMWDERSTQHFGAADHRGGSRTIKRVMVTGEVPA